MGWEGNQRAAGNPTTSVAGRRCPHAPLTDRLVAGSDPGRHAAHTTARRREWRGGLGFDGAPSIIHRRTATRPRPAMRTPPRCAGRVAVGRTRGRPDKPVGTPAQPQPPPFPRATP